MRVTLLILAIHLSNMGLAYTRPKVEADPAKVAELEYRTGGRFLPPSNGKSLLLWDSTGRASEAIAAFEKYNNAILHLSLSKSSLPITGDPYIAAKQKKNEKTPAIILFYESNQGATLAIYPEDVIATVNIKPLDINSKEIFNSRVQKECFRAIGLALGGYSMPRTPCVLESAYNPFDLDAIKCKTLAPMRFNGIVTTAKNLGIPLLRPVPYRVAVIEGWAPAPTNEIQKAIWDKVHTMPNEPIKIKPETQKVTK